MKRIIVFFIAMALFSSCIEKHKNSSAGITQLIIEKYEIMRTSLKNGDAKYVLKMHTQDAILFLPNGKEVVGMIALSPFYKEVAATGIDISSKPTTIELLTDDVAFEVGTFTSTSKKGIQHSSKYINIWKKVDGEWRIYKAIDQAEL
jgi:ketosteroid isomerase-like protein